MSRMNHRRPRGSCGHSGNATTDPGWAYTENSGYPVHPDDVRRAHEAKLARAERARAAAAADEDARFQDAWGPASEMLRDLARTGHRVSLSEVDGVRRALLQRADAALRAAKIMKSRSRQEKLTTVSRLLRIAAADVRDDHHNRIPGGRTWAACPTPASA